MCPIAFLSMGKWNSSFLLGVNLKWHWEGANGEAKQAVGLDGIVDETGLNMQHSMVQPQIWQVLPLYVY